MVARRNASAIILVNKTLRVACISQSLQYFLCPRKYPLPLCFPVLVFPPYCLSLELLVGREGAVIIGAPHY